MAVYNPDAVVLAIDTSTYAGNFERELCGDVTGQFGQCGVGEGEAKEAREFIQHLDWLDKHIKKIADDNECERPCSIWHSVVPSAEGGRPEYNSVGIFFDEVPPADVLAELLERAQAYCTNNALGYRGYRILVPTYKTVSIVRVSGHQLLTQ